MRPLFGSNVLGSTWRDQLEADAEEMWGELDSPESYNAVYQGGEDDQENYTDLVSTSDQISQDDSYTLTNITTMSGVEAPSWWLNLSDDASLATWQQFLRVLEEENISLDLFNNYMENRKEFNDFELMHIEFFELDPETGELDLILDNIQSFANSGVQKPSEYYGSSSAVASNNNQTSGGSVRMPPRYMDDSLPGGGSDIPPQTIQPSVPTQPVKGSKGSKEGVSTKKKVVLFGGVALVGLLAYKIVKD